MSSSRPDMDGGAGEVNVIAGLTRNPAAVDQSTAAGWIPGQARDDKVQDDKPRVPFTPSAWLQATPFSLVFLFFFLVPLALTLLVSFWNFNEYELLPGFTLRNYAAIFEGCSHRTAHGDLCVTLATYLSTLKFCVPGI